MIIHEDTIDFGYLHIAKFDVKYIFSKLVGKNNRHKYIDVFGYNVNVAARRYKVFKKSIRCVSCGLVPEFSCLDILMDKKRMVPAFPGIASFNFYGFSKEGRLFFLTLDHIVPLSKNGSDGIRNLQTMCNYCNTKKDNQYIKGKRDGRLVKRTHRRDK
jgi:hypothetical protein